MTSEAEPSRATELLIRRLPPPRWRSYRNAIVTQDMPEGSLRAFNAAVRGVPGARHYGSYAWTFPLAEWVRIRAGADPEVPCLLCKGLIPPTVEGSQSHVCSGPGYPSK